MDQAFGEFWRIYPNRVRREKAHAEFIAQCISTTPERIVIGKSLCHFEGWSGAALRPPGELAT